MEKHVLEVEIDSVQQEIDLSFLNDPMPSDEPSDDEEDSFIQPEGESVENESNIVIFENENEESSIQNNGETMTDDKQALQEEFNSTVSEAMLSYLREDQV
jgi:hypothetical protein